jgi:hypothetical protein
LEAASEQEASPPAARRADQAERNIASSDGTTWGKCLRIREGYCSSSMTCCLENKTRIKEHDTRTIRG